MRRGAGIVIAAFIVAACSSIPLATLTRMAGYDARTLAAIDPAALRARVTVPQGFVLDPALTHLAVSVTVQGDAMTRAFTLEARR